MLQHPVMFQKSSLVLPTSQLQFVFCVPLLFNMRAALSGNCFHVCSGRNLNSTASITNLWSEVRCCCEPDLITSTSVGPQFNCFYTKIIHKEGVDEQTLPSGLKQEQNRNQRGGDNVVLFTL